MSRLGAVAVGLLAILATVAWSDANPGWLEELLSRPVISVEEAARYLSISRGQAYRLAQEGSLPGCLSLGHRRVVRTALLARALGIETGKP